MSKRYNEKDKLRLVSGWAESGQSRSSYAKRHGVSVGSLARWEAELGSAGVVGGGMRFVEVDVETCFIMHQFY
ncbi:MAG: transposase [Verrucomicrobiales bacterium]